MKNTSFLQRQMMSMKMNKNLIVIGITIILLAVGLSGCADLFVEGGRIDAELLEDSPTNYINVTEQQLEQFPHLKQALNQTDTQIEPPIDEWNELHDFFGDTWANIYYQEKYYYVRLLGNLV